MKTATEVKTLKDMMGHAILYKLSESVDYREGKTEYVVVSALDVPSIGPETYIFASNKDGVIMCWGEMDGSFKGDLNHKEALSNAGFSII